MGPQVKKEVSLFGSKYLKNVPSGQGPHLGINKVYKGDGLVLL